MDTIAGYYCIYVSGNIVEVQKDHKSQNAKKTFVSQFFLEIAA